MTTVVRIEITDDGRARPEVRTTAEAAQEFDGGPDVAATALDRAVGADDMQVAVRDGGVAPDGPVPLAIGNGHRAS